MKTADFSTPVTVALHHHVLVPWAELRRTLPEAPRVISLDFHTDTLSALRRGMTMASGSWQAPEAVQEAVDTLHHDEHFDWALRTGLISHADIIAVSLQNGEPAHPAMQVWPLAPELTPDAVLQTPEAIRHLADHALELLPELPATEPYILDVDCDFFLTGQACRVLTGSRFAEWVRHAAMITLSREDDWVKLLRLPGETFTGEELAGELTNQCLRFR